MPSLNQSLLSGFSPVGSADAPAYDGPSTPMSGGAAAAAPTATTDNRKARSRLIWSFPDGHE